MQTKTRASSIADKGRGFAALQFSKVLVPVDFSKCSLAALKYAVRFALEHQSRLILMHVVEPIIYPTTGGFTSLAAMPVGESRDAAKKKMKQWLEREIPPGLKFEVKFRTGQAYREITRAALELKVDLVIIATHGYTGLKHALLGSTAERVVRHGLCPVLTVRCE